MIFMIFFNTEIFTETSIMMMAYGEISYKNELYVYS